MAIILKNPWPFSLIMRMLHQTSKKVLSPPYRYLTQKIVDEKNIPSSGGQVLIQVRLIQSLPFVTTMKNKNTTTTTKKIPDRNLNT